MQAIHFKIPTILLLLSANLAFAQQNLGNDSNGHAQGSQFQLASPNVTHAGVFFENETEITLSLSFENTRIHYSLDGSEPTEASALYNKPLRLKESGTLSAKAFHPTCQPSETVRFQFFKIKKTPRVKSIHLTSPASENYPGTGAAGLLDQEKGGSNFRAAEWLGFNGVDVEVWIEFEEAFAFEEITASMLSEPNSWIFLPSALTVFTSDDGQAYQQIATSELAAPEPEMPTGMQFPTVAFAKTESRFIKVLVKNLETIPDWHPGKGAPAWLFIDEILIE